MPDTLRGFPFWTLEFRKDARPRDPAAIDRVVAAVKAEGLTDLFLFSHGWNNDRTDAMAIYEGFFAEMRTLLDDPAVPKRNPAARIGVAGVIWPSILWPDDAPRAGAAAAAGGGGGGAVSLGGGRPPPAAPDVPPAALNAELRKAYTDEGQRELIDELTRMLAERPRTDAALRQFRSTLDALLKSEDAEDGGDRALPDSAEGGMTELDDATWKELLDTLGTQARERGATSGAGAGAVGIGDFFEKLWDGAKDALRVATYWQMKQRAGVVGKRGLGPLVLGRLAAEAPGVRVHLLGHSFGARLVSYALVGMPAALTGRASPVKSLFLLQGAFSHYAFADQLPHDRRRAGALKGAAARVDGPLLTTHSEKDTAVGVAYPAASIVNNDDAADFSDMTRRWGAMGHDGAQAVAARGTALAPPPAAYDVADGQWLNLDGNRVIVRGGPPSGAHSDIIHPHTAWAALAAAKLV